MPRVIQKQEAFKWLSLLCCQATILGDFDTANAQSRSTVTKIQHKTTKFISHLNTIQWIHTFKIQT